VADIEEAVRDRLAADATVAALVSTRIYGQKLPPGTTLPALTFFRVGPSRRVSAMGGDTGLAVARFQVSSWAETYDALVTLAAAVRGALKRMAGSIGTPAVTVDACFLENEIDLDDPDAKIRQRPQDYEIWYQEG